MLVKYEDDGRIMHIINDPVPQELVDMFVEQNIQHLNVATVPWPETPLFNTDNEPVWASLGVQAMASAGWDSVPCDILTDYVANGQITARPRFDVPASIELNLGEQHVISGLPSPCRVRLDGSETVFEGGELTLGADMPSEFSLVLDQWPYIPAPIRVIVRA